jgi:hypothetical protein
MEVMRVIKRFLISEEGGSVDAAVAIGLGEMRASDTALQPGHRAATPVTPDREDHPRS